MNRSNLSTIVLISIRLDLTIHGPSFKDRKFVAKELLKLSNTVDT